MKKIMLDPGHGGSDSGATNDGYREKDFTLKISNMVREYLEGKNACKVLMSRNRDVTLSLENRAELANVNNVDYFVSIHVNAGGGTGYESYVYSGSVPSRTIKRQELMHMSIMDRIKSYGVRDRGQKRADFYVLHYTRMDAILLENLFIDTEKDLDLLNSSKFRKDLVEGIGDGIINALKY